MEAKLKAKELVDKFTKGLFVNGNPNHATLHAKQCALICVDEIRAKHFDDWDSESEWWNEVKSEIEKL